MRSGRRAVVPTFPANPAHKTNRQIAKRGDDDDRERLGYHHSGPNDEQGEDRQRRQRAMSKEPLGQIIGQPRIFGDARWARRMHSW